MYGNHITVPRAGLRVQYTAAVKIICAGNVTGDGFFPRPIAYLYYYNDIIVFCRIIILYYTCKSRTDIAPMLLFQAPLGEERLATVIDGDR